MFDPQVTPAVRTPLSLVRIEMRIGNSPRPRSDLNEPSYKRSPSSSWFYNAQGAELPAAPAASVQASDRHAERLDLG
jgi:hypothetical protein